MDKVIIGILEEAITELKFVRVEKDELLKLGRIVHNLEDVVRELKNSYKPERCFDDASSLHL